MPKIKPYDYLPRGVDSVPRATSWAQAHRDALANPRGLEVGIVNGLKGWCAYATANIGTHGCEIGEDHALGPAWARWGGRIAGPA